MSPTLARCALHTPLLRAPSPYPAQVASTSADLQPDEKDPEVELVLADNEYTTKMWPHKFKAVSMEELDLQRALLLPSGWRVLCGPAGVP